MFDATGFNFSVLKHQDINLLFHQIRHVYMKEFSGWSNWTETQTCSSCALLLFQEVFWGEDRPVLRLAWLVHGDAVSCSFSRPLGVPVWHLHSGALPGQVNTPPLFSDQNICLELVFVFKAFFFLNWRTNLICFTMLFVFAAQKLNKYRSDAEFI